MKTRATARHRLFIIHTSHTPWLFKYYIFILSFGNANEQSLLSKFLHRRLVIRLFSKYSVFGRSFRDKQLSINLFRVEITSGCFLTTKSSDQIFDAKEVDKEKQPVIFPSYTCQFDSFHLDFVYAVHLTLDVRYFAKHQVPKPPISLMLELDIIETWYTFNIKYWKQSWNLGD